MNSVRKKLSLLGCLVIPVKVILERLVRFWVGLCLNKPSKQLRGNIHQLINTLWSTSHKSLRDHQNRSSFGLNSSSKESQNKFAATVFAN